MPTNIAFVHVRLWLGCAKFKMLDEFALGIFWDFCSIVRFWFPAGSGGTSMAVSELSQFSSPLGKLVQFFKSSRDRWKAKQKKLKVERKLLLNQTRAVEKSRKAWRERASAAEKRVSELEREVAELKSRSCSASPR